MAALGSDHSANWSSSMTNTEARLRIKTENFVSDVFAIFGQQADYEMIRAVAAKVVDALPKSVRIPR